MAGEKLNHRQRVDRCISGDTTDRIPVALWRHFPVDDQTPEGLASATVFFQQTYDFDLVKITPPSSFCLKDWGVQDRWIGNFEGTREYIAHPIQQPEDWENLQVLNCKNGSLGAQLRCLEILVPLLIHSAPLLQTIFSPLAQAKNLVGAERLIVHLRAYPDAVHAGLRTITETTIAFLKAVLATGVDGIFYAVQQARLDALSEREFVEFGRFYDLQVLNEAQPFAYKMLHLHGEHVMAQQVKDYPVNIINWHDRHTHPSLKEALTIFPAALCGGLRRWETMVLGSPEDIYQEANDALDQTNGRRLILGTGCVLPIITSHGNIQAVRQFADNRVSG